MKTSNEEIRVDWSTRACACGRSHGRRRAGNHFEIDAGLGGAFGFIGRMRGRKPVVRVKPHDEMPFPDCSDKHGMTVFLHGSRLQGEFLDVAAQARRWSQN